MFEQPKAKSQLASLSMHCIDGAQGWNRRELNKQVDLIWKKRSSSKSHIYTKANKVEGFLYMHIQKPLGSGDHTSACV